MSFSDLISNVLSKISKKKTAEGEKKIKQKRIEKGKEREKDKGREREKEKVKKKKGKSSTIEAYIGDIPVPEDGGGQISLPEPYSEEKPPLDPYYQKGASFFKAARIISTLCLIGGLLLVMTAFSNVFTEENIKYLLKNLELNSSASSDSFETVYFETNQCFDASEFRGDFAFASEGRLEINDYKGTCLLSSSHSADRPILKASTKYLLLYDFGDTDYYIYNSFSRIVAKNTEKNILMCDMSNSGRYVIVTESIAFSSEVNVFDENFSLITEIKINENITAVKLSPDGKYLALSGVSISESGISSSVSVFDLSGGEKIIDQKLEEETAIQIEFTSCENEVSVAVLTNKYLSSITQAGVASRYEFEPSNGSLFAMNGDYFVYTSSTSGIDDRTKLTAVDISSLREANITASPGRITSLMLKDKAIYYVSEGMAVLIDSERNEKTAEIKDEKIIIPYSSERAFSVGGGKAEFIIFE